jgi:hypothetical protein
VAQSTLPALALTARSHLGPFPLTPVPTYASSVAHGRVAKPALVLIPLTARPFPVGPMQLVPFPGVPPYADSRIVAGAIPVRHTPHADPNAPRRSRRRVRDAAGKSRGDGTRRSTRSWRRARRSGCSRRWARPRRTTRVRRGLVRAGGAAAGFSERRGCFAARAHGHRGRAATSAAKAGRRAGGPAQRYSQGTHGVLTGYSRGTHGREGGRARARARPPAFGAAAGDPYEFCLCGSNPMLYQFHAVRPKRERG